MVARRLRPLVAVLVAVVVGASTLGALPAAAEDVAPTITLQPVGRLVTYPATYSLTANASPYTSVRWQERAPGTSTWTNVFAGSGQTSTTLTRSYSTSLELRAVFTNGTATTATDVAVMTHRTILTQPQPVTKAPGTHVTLSAGFQCYCPSALPDWQRSSDGGATWTSLGSGGPVTSIPTSDQKTTTYTFPLTAPEDAGLYRMELLNGPNGGLNTSNSALVSFGEAPVFSVAGTLSGPLGAERTLTATVTKGYPAPSIRWQERAAGGSTWSDIAGETGTTFTRTLTYELHGRSVRAVATNTMGTANSSIVTYSVGVAPTVSVDWPNGIGGSYGDEIVLTSTGTGTPAPTISWKRGATTIAGATDPTYSFILSPETVGSYVVTYTNGAGSAYRSVSVQLGRPGTLSFSDLLRTVRVGSTTTFTVTQPSLPYPSTEPTWERSLDGGTTWEPLGVTGKSLTLTGAWELQGALVRAVVTNAYGTAVSTACELRILAQVETPYVTQHPTEQKPPLGEPATFTAAASASSAAPTPQWQRSDDGGTTWADIAGATEATYTFLPAVADDSSQYRAVFTNEFGTATTNAALLRVGFPTGTVVADQPYFQYAGAAGTQPNVGPLRATFSVAGITGYPEPTVTWVRSYYVKPCAQCPATTGSTEIGTEATLTVPSITLPNYYTYTYFARFTNSVGTYSVPFTPLVASSPVMTLSPFWKVAAPGAEVTFSSAATGTPTPSAQWQRSDDDGASWADVAGATSGSLTVTVPEGGPDPRFRVRYSNVAGTATSGVARLVRDGSAPVVSASLSSASPPVGGAYGGPVTVALEASDAEGVESIRWSASGATVAGPTTVAGGTAGLVVDAVGTTTVSFTARDGAGNVSELQTVDVTIVGAPAAPSGLKAGLGDGSSVVSWNAPAAASVITGYRITPYVGAVAQAPQEFPAGTSALVTGLTNGTTYRFRVAALNAWGAGPEAQTALVTVGVPSFPSSLRGTGGDGLAQLTWVAPPDMGVAPTGYRITPYLGATALDPVTVGPVLTTTITGLTNGSTYTFRIVTLSPHGESVSANFPATTVGVLTHPGSLRATPGNGQAVLTWVAPPSLGIPITGYRITPYLGATELPATTVGPVLSATITGLTNGSTYTFRIVTLWDTGTSAFATFPATTIGVLRPPTSLKATSGDGQALLTWVAPPFQGISPSGYRITPYLGSTALAPTTVGPVTSATVTGLENGSTYTFRVVSLSGFGTSTYTISAPVTIGVVSAPGGLRATSGNGEARLVWNAPPSIGIEPTGYRITPYLGSTALDPITVGPVLTTTITGLTNGSTYTFRIVTLTEHGASTHATFPATTIGIPTHPGTLRAFPGDSEVRLTWVAPASIGIEPTGYRITPYIGSTALDPITVGPVLTTTITGLTNGTTYTFRIVTLSPHGESISAGFPAATPTAPGEAPPASDGLESTGSDPEERFPADSGADL